MEWRGSPSGSMNRTDLEEVPVGISKEASGFRPALVGLCKEHGAACTQVLVRGVAVADADRERMIDAVGVGRFREGDGRLVLGWPCTSNHHQPRAKE